MKKKSVVSWSPRAKESYIETILFILEKWTISEVENFEKETKRVVKNLSFNLKLCPEIHYKKE